MKKIAQVIVVEGKYDLIKLSSIVDALIITTDGFRIFKDKEKRELIKAVGGKNGVIILTDSDAAGFKIRAFLTSILPKEMIRHAYIPNIEGKERRKDSPSKEGLLGVEGVNDDVIIDALEKAGAQIEILNPNDRRISKFDLFDLGLSGRQDSSELRRKLLKHMNLPTRMSSNSMLDVLNCLITYNELKDIMKKL